jgi:hypothetical protein
MLSFAERLSFADVAAGGGELPLTGTAEGIVADRVEEAQERLANVTICRRRTVSDNC